MSALPKLVRWKAWANALVFDAIGKMPDEALSAPQAIGFGNLLRTLNHVLAMDHVWRSHLLGQAHGLASRNPEYCPPFAEIRERQRAMDAWYVDYADTLAVGDEVIEFSFIGGGAGAMSRADIVLHVVTHGTYHRGHIAQMMRPHAAPPVTDYPVFLREHAASGRAA